MNTHPSPRLRPLGVRLAYHSRVLLTVSALAALAVSPRASAQVNLPSGPPYVTVSSAYAYSSSVAIGDMNGDGNNDVVLAVANSSNVQVVLGNGQGAFGTPQTFASGLAGAGPIALGDFNGDGNLDVAVVNRSANGTVAVLFGDGAGNLNAPVIYDLRASVGSAGNEGLNSIAVGDINGDGKSDLILTSNSQAGYTPTGKVWVLLNNGSGGFGIPAAPVWSRSLGYGQTPAANVAAADFDGDGHCDIVVTSNLGTYGGTTSAVVTVLFGDGSGAFPVSFGRPFPVFTLAGVGTANANNTAGLAVADMDRDGHPDLIVGAADFGTLGGYGSVTVFRYSGSRTFDLGATSVGWAGRTSDLAAGDLNNDGYPDVVMAGGQNGGGFAYLLNDGSGHLSAGNYIAGTGGAGGVALGDLTHSGPGTLDIVVGNGYGSSTQLLQNGPAALPAPPPTAPVAVSAPVISPVPADITVNATSSAGAAVSWSTVTATSNVSMEIFRRTTVTGEQWKPYTTTFTSARTGNFTLGFNVVSATGGDNSIFIDAVKVTGTPTTFTDGFEQPALATNTGIDAGSSAVPVALSNNWYFTNYGGVINGDPQVWGPIPTPPEGSQFAVLRDVLGKQSQMTSAGQFSLVAGQVYTVTFYQASRNDGVFAGAVTYTVTLNNTESVPVVATPLASGATFPIGTTTVTLTATNSAGGTTTGTFNVTVKGTPPVITAASPVSFEATGPAGVSVAAASLGSAVDSYGASVPITASPSGPYPIGITGVTLSATDAMGLTTTKLILVNVVDTTPPAITVPSNITAEATSASGAVVTFSTSATDIVDGAVSTTASPASGSTFAIGTTTVTVTATDAHHNTATKTFTVTVQDTTPPVITVPVNITAEATSASGAVVTFSTSATDIVDGAVSTTASPASGSTFAIGTTTVTVSATDAHHNTATKTFTVTVRDTTAPTISSVTPSSATLWPPNHQMVPITVSASASDNTGVTSLKIVRVTSSEPDNGLGDGDTPNDIQITGDLSVNLRAERSGKGSGRTYTITVQASDAYGNVSTSSCTVFVPKSQGGK